MGCVCWRNIAARSAAGPSNIERRPFPSSGSFATCSAASQSAWVSAAASPVLLESAYADPARSRTGHDKHAQVRIDGNKLSLARCSSKLTFGVRVGDRVDLAFLDREPRTAPGKPATDVAVGSMPSFWS